ncbi:hypothetical protein ACHAWX_003290 [Stephanocyclus meneghinianus]
MQYNDQEMEYLPAHTRKKNNVMWSNAATNDNPYPSVNKMESTNSDDGDYDVEGDEAEYGEEVHYPYGEDHGQDHHHNTNMHDNIDDVSREGSDVSSAEKYADRNSDPGVHVSEQNYSLPYLPTGGGGGPPNLNAGMMHGMNTNLYPGMKHGNAVAMPSGAESVSLGTATQTHEVQMPMLLSTFKPATGCTNASDFIVRCFVARLRSGITVVKHGRARWCKSRLRVLHVHPDGRSLSWKPALGEPSSGKRPPKLDLTTCKEVRHAWSPDPDNPMFTGTPILRQKCEAANAHKSFALIFPKRTVDITAVTADQCKVLMEGFSALCFRLQVAQNVAATTGGQPQQKGEKKDDNEGSTTASVTLTNSSAPMNSPGNQLGGKKRR